MTELEIITQAFFLLEQDDDVWEEDSSEYAVARGFLNGGISRWEAYDNTRWRELSTSISDASSGDKITTTSSEYSAASDFIYPSSFVYTDNLEWEVKKPEKVGSLINDQGHWCYFTGNKKTGFTLKFNPNVEMVSGQTITYDYFRKADRTADPDDEVEMSDPFFLPYFIAAHLGEDGLNIDFFNISEQRLEAMRVANMSGFFNIADPIDNVNDFVFGE